MYIHKSTRVLFYVTIPTCMPFLCRTLFAVRANGKTEIISYGLPFTIEMLLPATTSASENYKKLASFD